MSIDLNLTVEQTQALADSYPPAVSPESPTAWYDYVAVIDCIPPNPPERPRLEICGFAISFCEENVPESSGPRSVVTSSQRSRRLPSSARTVSPYAALYHPWLKVTDPLTDKEVVVPPAGIVRHDGDDPYLVVAADKGTAT